MSSGKSTYVRKSKPRGEEVSNKPSKGENTKKSKRVKREKAESSEPVRTEKTNKRVIIAAVAIALILVVSMFFLIKNAGDRNMYDMTPMLSVSESHTLALKNDGTVWAWGGNTYGLLGDGTTTNRTSPVHVVGLKGMTAVAAGSSHSVALKNDGTVWTWGDNRRGQLGMGGSDSNVHSTPAQVPGLTDVTAVSARGTFTLALKSDGTVWSWGSNHITETDGSSLGGLGDGTNKQHNSPVEIIKDVKKIAAGIAHALVLKNDGTIWGWGNNFSGQLGDGTNVTPRLSPVKAVNITDIKDISLGRFHSLVLKNDGTVWGWGNGLVGQLGDGKRNSVNTPVKAAGLTDVKVISTGENHSLAVRENGEIWLWGNNSNTSPLGVGTSETVQDSPARLTSLTGIKTASAGSSSNIALKDNGTLWAWGGNGSGQLGDGKTSSRSTPGEIGINIGTASPPKMVTSSLPGGTVGTAYSQTLKADGSGPMTWSIESGTLPNGLVLSPIKGTITGTPAASGPFALVLKATNSEGSATVSLTLTISDRR